MGNNGWLKLHRELKGKSIWKCSTPEQKVILITLLMMVNHEANEWEWNGNKYTVKPGQCITSLKSIAEEAGQGISIQNIRSALLKFEKYEFLTNKSTNKNRLITITNWELYQSRDKELTSKSTIDQQATNKQLTTNKNEKNDKNKYSYQNSHLDIAKKLQLLILEVNPGNRCKNADLKKWANEIRLVQEKDERTDEQLHSMLDYIFNKDDFWKDQIQSPSNLRKHWDKIYPKIYQDINKQYFNTKKDEYDPYKNFKRL